MPGCRLPDWWRRLDRAAARGRSRGMRGERRRLNRFRGAAACCGAARQAPSRANRMSQREVLVDVSRPCPCTEDLGVRLRHAARAAEGQSRTKLGSRHAAGAATSPRLDASCFADALRAASQFSDARKAALACARAKNLCPASRRGERAREYRLARRCGRTRPANAGVGPHCRNVGGPVAAFKYGARSLNVRIVSADQHRQAFA